jgi:hypothetical protein
MCLAFSYSILRVFVCLLAAQLQEIQRIWVANWSKADAQLGKRLAAKLCVEVSQ